MSKPWFSTNRDGETVADDLNGYIGWLQETWRKPFERDWTNRWERALPGSAKPGT